MSVVNTTGRNRTWTAIVVGAVLALALCVFALADLTLDRAPTAAAGSANLRSLAPFWVTAALSWSTLTVLAIVLAKRERARIAPVNGGVLVIAVAVIARLVVLFTHQPSLSDDIYRYVFDGRNLVAGVNPYLVRPADRVTAIDERYPGERALAERINNAEMHTIYLPASQWAFAAAAAVRPVSLVDPDRGALVVRVMLVTAETAMLVLLLLSLRHANRSPWWLALYAWHPLPLSEIAGSGHQDALGIALLVAALLINQIRPRVVPAWAAAVAIAAIVKPVALPAAAFMLRHRNARAWVVCGVVGVIVTAALAGPLLLADNGTPIDNLRETATRFTLKWAHFGAVYEPVLTGIERATPDWGNDPQEQLARKICTGVLAILAVVIWIRGRSPWTSCALLVVAAVLLAPAAHPWYLLWALALFPMTPIASVWVLSLTLPWGYAVLGDTVDWTVPPWLMVCAYAPVAAALVWDLRNAFTPLDSRP